MTTQEMETTIADLAERAGCSPEQVKDWLAAETLKHYAGEPLMKLLVVLLKRELETQ